MHKSTLAMRLVRRAVLPLAVGVSLLGASTAGATLPAKSLTLAKGTTTLTFTPAATSKLGAAQATFVPQAPITSSGSKFTFPIAGGKIDGKTLKGSINHKGSVGIKVPQLGATPFGLGTPRITLSGRGKGALTFNTVGTLASVVFSPSSATLKGKLLTIKGIKFNLDGGIAKTLKDFGIDVPAGTTVANAVISATTK